MPSAAKLAWSVVGSFVRRRFLKAALRGRPWGLRFGTWQRITRDRWWSLDEHLLRETEASCRDVVTREHPLAEILSKDDWANGWAATPMTLLLLWKRLIATRPRAVLEMGSGISTRVFGYYARECERKGDAVPMVVSLDHDHAWVEDTRARLAQSGLGRYVIQIYAPLAPYQFGACKSRSYSLGHLFRQSNDCVFDLCFIDGPPGDTVGRAGTLPSIAHLLRDRARVLLDDFARPGEQEAVGCWKDLFPRNLTRIRGILTGHGLCEMRWRNAN
jgi:predicted O-methyltransferase YrrM